MLFPEYHNRFRYKVHVSLRKWGFINQLEIFLLSISKKKYYFFLKKTRAPYVHYKWTCSVNSLHYYTCTTESLVVELEHLKTKTRLKDEKFPSVKGECET
jgi:hypothetical protein